MEHLLRFSPSNTIIEMLTLKYLFYCTFFLQLISVALGLISLLELAILIIHQVTTHLLSIYIHIYILTPAPT